MVIGYFEKCLDFHDVLIISLRLTVVQKNTVVGCNRALLKKLHSADTHEILTPAKVSMWWTFGDHDVISYI